MKKMFDSGDTLSKHGDRKQTDSVYIMYAKSKDKKPPQRRVISFKFEFGDVWFSWSVFLQARGPKAREGCLGLQ